MSESSIATARQALLEAWAALDVVSGSVSGQDAIDQLLFLRSMSRRADYGSLRIIAQLDSDGEFAERGVRPAAGVADLLRCTRVEARRMVAVAASVFPTSLAGVALEPRLPATATVLGGWEIDRAHAEVIERALSSDAAGRLDPEVWTSVEATLADYARLHRPDELAKFAAKLIECLDQDGPPPEDEDQQVNELHLSKSRTGGGGRIKGTLDAATFDVFARAIKANLTRLGRDKTLGERQAEALGAICERVLDDGYLTPHSSLATRRQNQYRQPRDALSRTPPCDPRLRLDSTNTRRPPGIHSATMAGFESNTPPQRPSPRPRELVRCARLIFGRLTRNGVGIPAVASGVRRPARWVSEIGTGLRT